MMCIRENISDIIKSTVYSVLPDSRILLFGSRAKNTSDSHSDYDLLIITPDLLTRKEKLNWSTQLHKAIAKAIHAPLDLLLYSDEEINQKQGLPGQIVRSAIREGIAL
jgi:uncharacterized protein